MTESLAAMAAAFSQLPQRPAVFDRRVRRDAQQWWLGAPIDVDAILDAFAEIDAFQTGDGGLRIPIHEPDSAELTGEFLRYDARTGGAGVAFYDFSERGLVEIDLEEFRYSYPAWRIRFWSPHTNPERVPSYLRQAEGRDGAQPTPQIGGAPSTAGDAGIASTGDAGIASTGDAGIASAGDAGIASAGDEFFEGLRSFVEREREAERESTRNVYRSMNQQAFFEEYNGVQHVEPLGREVGEYGEQIVGLHVAAEPDAAALDVTGEYSLYPGSEVFIDRVDDPAGFPVEAELFDVDGRRLDVGVYWDSSSDKAAAEEAFSADSGARFVVGELVNPVPFDRQLDAVSTVEADDRKRAIVTGRRSLGVEEESYAHVGADLNPVQQTAARNALRAEDVYCIHGPPGTGKTRTLTEVIRAAANENARVLACAHSNQAVDNLLVGSSTPERPDPRSIHADAVDGDVTVARVGDHSANAVVRDRYADEDAWQADVVGATMSAASDLADDMFDVAVIDEATQATIPSTLIPFAKAERVVLAGDHKQLPPYHSGERHTVEQPEFSLFEHLLEVYGPEAVSTTLTTQYRMHEAIAAYPNAAFYDGVLTHGQRNRRWTIGSLDPIVAYDVEGAEDKTPSDSSFNRAEAAVVASEVERLLDFGLLPSEIGVITPYDGQIGIIRSELNSELSGSRAAEVKVNTIDSFQGSEREAVIVSFVRSNPDGAIGFLDFPVEGPRRLNVALTRAQKRLVLIGNWDTLTAASPRDGESATPFYQSLKSHLESANAFDPRPD